MLRYDISLLTFVNLCFVWQELAFAKCHNIIFNGDVIAVSATHYVILHYACRPLGTLLGPMRAYTAGSKVVPFLSLAACSKHHYNILYPMLEHILINPQNEIWHWRSIM